MGNPRTTTVGELQPEDVGHRVRLGPPTWKEEWEDVLIGFAEVTAYRGIMPVAKRRLRLRSGRYPLSNGRPNVREVDFFLTRPIEVLDSPGRITRGFFSDDQVVDRLDPHEVSVLWRMRRPHET